MKMIFALVFVILPSISFAEDFADSPPPKPEKIEPVENECEEAFPLFANREVPRFFLNEDGTFKCNAIAVPRSQAGNAILLADWADGLNRWYQLDIETREAQLQMIKSSHKVELQSVKKNARIEGAILGSSLVLVSAILIFSMSL